MGKVATGWVLEDVGQSAVSQKIEFAWSSRIRRNRVEADMRDTNLCSKVTAGMLALFVFLPLPLAGQRASCEGAMWLKWNRGRRESFLRGYVIAYGSAYWVGCREAVKALPPGPSHEAAFDACELHQPDLSQGTSWFSHKITAFYQCYPGDRDLYIPEVFDQLENGLTIEQIHEHPFLRHQTGTPGPSHGRACSAAIASERKN